MTMTHRVGTWVAATILSVGGAAVTIAQEARPASAGVAQDAKPAAGLGQAIQVHGHWVIEVKNPDGSLASRHEFENDLVPSSGNRALAGLLGRFYQRVYQWSIRLVTPEQDVCGLGLGGPGCRISEFFGTGSAPTGMLTVYVPTFDVGTGTTIPDSGTLQLRGTAQFVVAGSITSVGADVSVCPDTSCSSRHPYNFTSRILPGPITVAANQLVQVTVIFSFS